MNAIELRDLSTLEDFVRVVELERRVWGLTTGEDVVPVAVLAATTARGGILIGALHGAALVGFVYSFPGLRSGQLTQWSHMLGVLPEYRSSGLGRRLKLAQRERALGMGIELVEWTYDPLVALNAHLNFAKLGIVVEEYGEDVYGASTSPLHGDLPTDRFIAQWWLRTPHVERRIAPSGTLPLVSQGSLSAPTVNSLEHAGRWLRCGPADASLDHRRVAVLIPTNFLAMLEAEPVLAREWRERTREIFTGYFSRGYRAVDFLFDRTRTSGRYILEAPARG